MRIIVEQKGESVLLVVEGRLDAQSAPEFEAACKDGGGRDLIADLAGLEYISSAGLRSILAVVKDLEARGGRLRLCGLTGMVRDVFTLSGLMPMFVVADTVDELLGK
ncbi:STAS domain-containing protein [Desulfocurvus sp. DL9XJH121]